MFVFCKIWWEIMTSVHCCLFPIWRLQSASPELRYTYMLVMDIWLKILWLCCKIVLSRLYFKICNHVVTSQIIIKKIQLHAGNLNWEGNASHSNVLWRYWLKPQDHLQRNIKHFLELKMFLCVLCNLPSHKITVTSCVKELLTVKYPSMVITLPLLYHCCSPLQSI